MHRTAESAPTDAPILVWVEDLDVRSRKPMGWRMGRCVKYDTLAPKLLGDGLNGDWTIRYWHPLPDDINT